MSKAERMDQLRLEIYKREQELKRLAHESDVGRPSSTPKWDGLTPKQQRWCQFMAYDPDNPEVPLD